MLIAMPLAGSRVSLAMFVGALVFMVGPAFALAEFECGVTNRDYAPGERSIADASASNVFDQLWSPGALYGGDETFFVPTWQSELNSIGLKEAVITGLAATPCSSGVLYALADSLGSRLVEAEVGGGKPRSVVDADTLGQGLWFRAPMSLSPNRRWLLVSVAPDRQEALATLRSAAGDTGKVIESVPGDLWLVDCTGMTPARLIAKRTKLSSCTWSPSGAYAACTWEEGSGAPTVAVLDADSGLTRELIAGHAFPLWSLDGSAVLVYRLGEGQTMVRRYDVQTDELSSEANASFSTQGLSSAVWSAFSEVGAWIDSACDHTVHIRGVERGHRKFNAPSAVARLLGWSCGGKLLAFLGTDRRMRFAVGGIDEQGMDKWLSVLPAPDPSSKSPSLGLVMDKSPVEVSGVGELLAVWVELSHGPALVYVDTRDDGSQALRAIGFTVLSASRDWGYDLKEDLRPQVIRMKAESDLSQFWTALGAYAADHGGKLPNCETGEELAKAMRGYLEPCFLWPAYSPGAIGVRLLLPGRNFDRLRFGTSYQDARKIAVAELHSDDGYVFVMYLDARVDQVAPEKRPVARPLHPGAPVE